GFSEPEGEVRILAPPGFRNRVRWVPEARGKPNSAIASIADLLDRLAEHLQRRTGGRVLPSRAPPFKPPGATEGGFLHSFVGLGRAAHENHFLGPGQALVAVLAVETDAEDPGNGRFGFFAPLFLGHIPISVRWLCESGSLSGRGAEGRYIF